MASITQAQTPKDESDTRPHLIADSNPFRKTYLSLEFGRNFPLSFSQNHYKTGPIHPILGYRYVLDEYWLMGVGAQTRIFERRDMTDSRELALWSIYHEASLVLRLDYPVYFLIGPKLIYMVPGKSGKIPLQRDELLGVEFGASLAGTLAWVAGDRLWTVRLERWRGTTTQKLHGLEIAGGISVFLP